MHMLLLLLLLVMPGLAHERTEWSMNKGNEQRGRKLRMCTRDIDRIITKRLIEMVILNERRISGSKRAKIY